jgi:hypothetical protein
LWRKIQGKLTCGSICTVKRKGSTAIKKAFAGQSVKIRSCRICLPSGNAVSRMLILVEKLAVAKEDKRQ